MPTKLQLDKEAWHWTETTKPEEITAGHIEIAYRVHLPVCTQATCRYQGFFSKFFMGGGGDLGKKFH